MVTTLNNSPSLITVITSNCNSSLNPVRVGTSASCKLNPYELEMSNYPLRHIVHTNKNNL